MKKIFFPFAVIILITSCSKTEVADASLSPGDAVALKMEAPGQVNFTEPNLFPEGVVYDKFNGRYYVKLCNAWRYWNSISRRQLLRIYR